MYLHHDRKLILRFVGWFFLFSTLLFWLLGYGYLEKILLSPSLFQNSYSNYTSIAEKTLITFFALVNYISYMMVLAYIPAFPVLVVAFLIPKKRIVWLLCILVGTLSLMLLIINNSIFSMYKFHLNLSVLRMAFDSNAIDVFEFSSRELTLFFLVFGVLILVEMGLAYFVWRKIVVPGKYLFGQTIAIFWLGGGVFSFLTLVLSISENINIFSQQTPNLPYYNQLLVHLIPVKNAGEILYRYSEEHFSQPIFSNEKMNYPLSPMLCEKPASPTNIILIMVDSLRFDSSKYNMPNLSRFSEKSWSFNNHLSGGNATQPGLFSIFYSIPANYWTAASKHQISPVFIQLLKQYDYLTKVIWSSVMINPPFHKTIYQEITDLNLHGAPQNDVGDRDRYVTSQAIQFLQANKNEKPFFLNLFYDAPHGYCQSQSYPTKYQPALKRCSRIAMTNEVNPVPYHNRYLNAVSFVDGELGKVLTSIAKEGYLKNSVVVITSDHGQEFNDNKQNYWGHAGNYTRSQVQVPLIIYWPNGKPVTIDHLTTSYDIVPTILKRVFNCQNKTIDYSIGQDLLVEKNRLPFVLSANYSNFGLIEPDRLTTLRTSGEVFIRDNKAEPLPNVKPRAANIKQALKLMRLYFVGD